MKTFEEWIKSGGYRPEHKRVRVELDTDKLYGNLDDAIKYLQDIRKMDNQLQIVEDWTGYEDMELVFEKIVIETQEEFYARITPAYNAYCDRFRHQEAVTKKAEDTERALYKKLKEKYG